MDRDEQIYNFDANFRKILSSDNIKNFQVYLPRQFHNTRYNSILPRSILSVGGRFSDSVASEFLKASCSIASRTIFPGAFISHGISRNTSVFRSFA